MFCKVSPFQSCLSGVFRPRSQRQRSKTCWIRSSVHELCSMVGIIFCRGITTSTDKAAGSPKIKILYIVFRSANVLCLFSSPNFLLLLFPTLHNDYCSSQETIGQSEKVHQHKQSGKCPRGRKHSRKYSLPLPTKTSESQTVWDELDENSGRNFYFPTSTSFLKSAADATFSMSQRGMEMNLTKVQLPIFILISLVKYVCL